MGNVFIGTVCWHMHVDWYVCYVMWILYYVNTNLRIIVRTRVWTSVRIRYVRIHTYIQIVYLKHISNVESFYYIITLLSFTKEQTCVYSYVLRPSITCWGTIMFLLANKNIFADKIQMTIYWHHFVLTMTESPSNTKSCNKR